MNKMKKCVVIAFMILGGIGVNAQSKVAHINVQELVKQMPGMIKAQKDLDELQKTYQAELQAELTKYQNLMKQYEGEAPQQTEATNRARVQEMADMERRIQQYRDDAATDMQKKEADLVGPILKRAQEAIEKVAKAKGYDYVLDSTQGLGVIMADGVDIMPDVKKELGF